VDECVLSYSVTLTDVNTGVDVNKIVREYIYTTAYVSINIAQ